MNKNFNKADLEVVIKLLNLLVDNQLTKIHQNDVQAYRVGDVIRIDIKLK